MAKIENPTDAAEPVRVLSDAETTAEFSGWGPPSGARRPVFGDATLARLLAGLHPPPQIRYVPRNADAFAVFAVPTTAALGSLAREIGRDRNGDPIHLILTESPPCQSFSTGGRLVDRAGLEALPGWIRIERDLALQEMQLPPVVTLPKPDRPTGRGRTSIPDTGERKAQLARRTERLRRRQSARVNTGR